MYGPLFHGVGGWLTRFLGVVRLSGSRKATGEEEGVGVSAREVREVPAWGASPVLPVFAPTFARGERIVMSSNKGEDHYLTAV